MRRQLCQWVVFGLPVEVQVLLSPPCDFGARIFTPLVAADGSARRLPTDGVILPGSIIFMVPADLAPGEYELEVRVRFEAKLRAGQLPDMLTVV